MIRREEILELASELGLRPQVVEKDYVLGWILAGIARDEELHNAWVFKGGTCLKKCYFETYRFSEDLDFTIKSTDHLNSDFLIGRFSALSEWLYDETGVELPADNRKKRLIEAYSLRRTSDNNILLHAVRHADGGDRTYRVDRIRGATITSQVFTPRYTIELTPTGLLSAPLTQRSAFAAPKMNSPLRPKSAKGFAAPKPAKIKTSSNTKHVFRCTVCGKTFRKSTYDGTLGEHKNKQGQTCFGRIGTFVKTDYKW